MLEGGYVLCPLSGSSVSSCSGSGVGLGVGLGCRQKGMQSQTHTVTLVPVRRVSKCWLKSAMGQLGFFFSRNDQEGSRAGTLQI